MMFHFRHAAASKLTLICTLLILPGHSWAIDLAGAWASSADQCSNVFKKNKNRITFVQDSDIHGAGFVADANQLRGRTARCTIKSRRQVGDTLNLLTACSTDIMLQNVEFSIKVLDDNKISRIFPGMEGMEITYYRCAF
ncbi:MAG: hypothetical protein ABSF22_27260 [Bryobacteraceae bacterium]|jgi:hypothetical protein